MPCLAITTTLGGGYIERTANLPAFAAVTMAGWVKLSASTAGTARMIASLVDAGVRTSGLSRWSDNNFQPLDSSLGTTISPAPSEAGVWCYIAWTRDNTNGVRFIWWDAAGAYQADEYALDGTTGTPDAMAVGCRASYNDQAYLGRYAYWKVWDRVLTQAQLEAEIFSPVFADATNANCGFAYSATDISGNGRDWTIGGTVQTVTDDGPPVYARPIDTSWTALDTGESYTLPVGGDRLVCAVICAESSSAATDVTLSTVTLGGVAGEIVAGPSGFVETSSYACAKLVIWDEGQLTGLSGAQTLSFSFSAGGATNSFARVRTFAGVHQSSHIVASTGSNYERTSGNATTELTVSVGTGVVGGYGIYGGICRSNTTSFSLTSPLGWTEHYDAAEDALSRSFGGGKPLTLATSESFGITASSSNSYDVGAWILNPVSGTGASIVPLIAAHKRMSEWF